ncbi:MAG TPA: radical SAM protein [Candidatus Limnocylindrales bacterium]|nr:radical SAM protein [Candidatus Limnocylindrales bacterium]
MGDTPLMDRWIRKTVERHLPWSVHFDLTYRCNERCVHCYLDHEDRGEMTTGEIQAVISQLAAAGTLFLTFSGGEIFLRPDLFELIGFARELHFDVSLKTNALLIDPARARKLRALCVRKVQVSIYSSDPAVHDAITKVRGSLNRSLAAIRFLQAEGLPVKIACPLMKQNLTAFRDVQKLAQELRVPYVLDLTITPQMDGDSAPLELRASAKDLLPVLTDPGMKKKPAPLSLSVLADLPDGCADSVPGQDCAYDGIPCSAGHNSCYISPYGDVFPCVQLPLPAGNVRQQKFEAIWFRSPEMNRVRSVRDAHLRVCSQCEISEYCERCPGLAQMEGGDLLGAYERACELAEMNARLAGVNNPISAMHLQQAAGNLPARIPVDRSFAPQECSAD